MEDGILKSAKDYLVAVPLLASALAMMFDVGYFNGIDINLFSIFTVSEHLVFALEALPLGLCLAIVPFATLYYFDHLDNEYTRRIGNQKGKTWFRVVAVCVGCGMLVLAYVWGILLSCVICLVAGIVSGNWRLNPPKVLPFLFWSGFIVFALSYSLGYDMSRRYLLYGEPDQIIETSSGELNVLLIRSGEKGLLFYNPKNRSVSFLHWDAVKQLRRPWQ